MDNIDLGIGWPVVEENDLFLSALKAECAVRGMSFCIFVEEDLPQAIESLKNGDWLAFYH